MNVRKRPCEQCPWRRDVRGGQFPADRYEKLANTSGERGNEAAIDAPLFACHKSSDDETMPCAGWLAAVGRDSLRVRILALRGEIPVEALDPREDWPPLFESFDEMVAAQSGEAGARSVCFNDRCAQYGVVQTVSPGYPCPVCSTVTGEFTTH